jgi:excisionase family DNA binding protein
MDIVFTLEEAADRLRISRATLYRLVKAGEVPHRKISKRAVSFTESDIAKILAAALCEPEGEISTTTT